MNGTKPNFHRMLSTLRDCITFIAMNEGIQTSLNPGESLLGWMNIILDPTATVDQKKAARDAKDVVGAVMAIDHLIAIFTPGASTVILSVPPTIPDLFAWIKECRDNILTGHNLAVCVHDELIKILTPSPTESPCTGPPEIPGQVEPRP